MKRILLILGLALTGLGGGIGAGLALRVTDLPPDEEAACAPTDKSAPKAEIPEAETGDEDYVKLSNQFVVPVVAEGRVGSLVVMSLSLEVAQGSSDAVYEREPRLRDALLQAMFDHANAGGFDGSFTKGGQLNALRMALRETAQSVVGPVVRDVLILDIVRQDA